MPEFTFTSHPHKKLLSWQSLWFDCSDRTGNYNISCSPTLPPWRVVDRLVYISVQTRELSNSRTNMTCLFPVSIPWISVAILRSFYRSSLYQKHKARHTHSHCYGAKHKLHTRRTAGMFGTTNSLR